MIERARELRKIIENLSSTMTDEDALKAVELFPNWEADTAYITSDRVRYNDILYSCLMAHTSQSDWTPSASPSLWARVLIPDPEVIPEWVQPESTNPYMKGDKVRHLDKIWVSTIDYNVYEPSIYGWEEVNG